MTERVVTVTLRAQIANYLANMEQVRKTNRQTGTEAEQLAKKTQAQSEAMKQLGLGMVAIGSIAAVGVAIAVKKFAEFDQAMSNVKAATQESAANMELLRDAALDAGARTVFSATEAANAIEELGKAGLTTQDILSGGLDASLDLAAAGGLGVAEAAGIAATALKVFKLEGKDMGHVADLMAAGAGKAMGDVTDLSAALAQSGMVAKSTGLSIDETTGSLAAFASQGLLGSDAGTSFKTMLGALTPNSAAARDEMERLGISAYDAQGKFVGMEKFAGNLQTSLFKLTDEQRSASLEIMFGSDAVRAATVLYSEGEKGIADWNDKVNDSGYAAKVAADRLNNLAGDIEGLGGAFDTALIKSGSAANDSLRFLTQAATNLLDVFNGAPEIVQTAALVIGGLTVAVGLGGGAFLIAVPKVVAYRAALDTLSPAAKTAGAAVAGVGKAIGVLAIAAVAVASVNALAQLLADRIGPSAEETTNALVSAASAADQFRAAITERYSKDMGPAEVERQVKGLSAALQDAADNSANWTDVIGGDSAEILASVNLMGKEYAKLAATDLPAAQAKFGALSKEMGLNATEQWRLLENMPDYKQALIEQANALDIDVTSTDAAANKTALLKLAQEQATPVALTAADAYLKAADEASGLDGQVRALIDSINEANGVGQDAVTSNNAYQNALLGVDEQIRKATEGLDENEDGIADYINTLDRSTLAGRDNEDMLVDLASKSQDAAKAQFDLDGNTENYRSTLEAGHQAVVDRAIALGATAEEAQNLADKIYAIPSEKQFQLIADTATAAASVASFITAWDGKRINVTVGTVGTGGQPIYTVPGTDVRFNAKGSVMDFYANGGMRENHVAQIAPAGSWRVWGEPETGGEAYIPLASSKRERSLGIWAETGNRLGVAGFAGGGFMSGRDVQYEPSYPMGGGGGSGSSTRAVTSTVNVTAYTNDPNAVAAAVQAKQNWELRNG